MKTLRSRMSALLAILARDERASASGQRAATRGQPGSPGVRCT